MFVNFHKSIYLNNRIKVLTIRQSPKEHSTLDFHPLQQLHLLLSNLEVLWSQYKNIFESLY